MKTNCDYPVVVEFLYPDGKYYVNRFEDVDSMYNKYFKDDRIINLRVIKGVSLITNDKPSQ